MFLVIDYLFRSIKLNVCYSECVLPRCHWKPLQLYLHILDFFKERPGTLDARCVTGWSHDVGCFSLPRPRNLEALVFGSGQQCVVVELAEEMPTLADLQQGHARLRALCLGGRFLPLGGVLACALQ